jgi:glyoxylase-like metal-dependent hydrolase (beta-lactamase superfamily II)
MIKNIAPGLSAFKIRLVGNPLRDLNCYVFTGKERNLLIDTGFNQKECLEDLRAGIAEMNLDMDKTDVLATHCHSDHCGLIGQIISEKSAVYMGANDKAIVEYRWDNNGSFKKDFTQRYLDEGFPRDLLEFAFANNPATALAATKRYAMRGLKEGDVIQAGDSKLVCIDTPGHTPGHMCFYERDKKIMVLGDHVLFDITPNITAWNALPNALRHYLQSLAKIKAYDVELPLPAHREFSCAMSARVDELLAHHARRLDETRCIIKADPGINGYQIAARLTWSIKAKNWDDFPIAQKWFAVGEALSHIDYLVEEKKIARSTRGGITAYTADN